MFDFRSMFKQIVAAGSSAFVAAFPAALAGDLKAAKAAVLAGIAAGIGCAAGLAGNLFKQILDRARGILKAGSSEAVEYLDLAEQYIAEAKHQLS